MRISAWTLERAAEPGTIGWRTFESPNLGFMGFQKGHQGSPHCPTPVVHLLLLPCPWPRLELQASLVPLSGGWGRGGLWVACGVGLDRPLSLPDLPGAPALFGSFRHCVLHLTENNSQPLMTKLQWLFAFLEHSQVRAGAGAWWRGGCV